MGFSILAVGFHLFLYVRVLDVWPNASGKVGAFKGLYGSFEYKKTFETKGCGPPNEIGGQKHGEVFSPKKEGFIFSVFKQDGFPQIP